MTRSRSSVRSTCCRLAGGLCLLMALTPSVVAQGHLPGEVVSTRRIELGQGGLPPTWHSFNFGRWMTSVGDIDGDGVTDIAIGDPSNPGGGAVWIVRRHPDGTARASKRINWTSLPLENGDIFGFVLTSLDDLDGDGVRELVSFGGGDMRVVFLDTDSTVKSSIAQAVDPEAVSLASIGDVDGNGTGDLALGIPGAGPGSNTGAVEILFMTSAGTVASTLRISNATPHGLPVVLESEQQFGTAVAGVGDLDGDGVPDMAVSGVGFDFGPVARTLGRVFVLLLNSDGTVKDAAVTTEDEGGAAIHQSQPPFPAGFGFALAALGDVNGDGTRDLAVGIPWISTATTFARFGAVSIAFLDETGAFKSHHLQTYPEGGVEPFDEYGRSLAYLESATCGAAGNLAIGAEDDFEDVIWIASYELGDWTDLGQGLAGAQGVPVLSGTGTLVTGDPTTLDLTGGAPGALAILVLGVFRADAPFKGGVLVPFPHVVAPGLPLDGNGDVSLAFPWPECLPSSVPLIWQVWIPDGTGPAGFAASNAVESRSY